MVKDVVFGMEFFDGGKKEPWSYQSYSLEEQYPFCQIVAGAIKARFNPKRVLDVGCAKGFLVKAFNDLGMEAWGIDVSEYALSSAPVDVRAYLYRVDLNQDVLPFGDQYFDFVTFLGTVECLHDHKNALREIRRVLKPGGGLYLRTTYKTDPRDTIRKNIHSRGFWLKEFRCYGFKFVPGWLDPLTKEWGYGTLLFARR